MSIVAHGPLFSEFDPQQSLNQDKWQLTIPWARSCQYQCVCKISSQYSTQFKSYGQLMIFLVTKFSNFEIFFEKKKQQQQKKKKKKKNNNKSVGRISWFLNCLKKKTKTIRLVQGLNHVWPGTRKLSRDLNKASTDDKSFCNPWC